MIQKKAKAKLMNIFKAYDVEKDTLDYEALWDNSLADEENLHSIGTKIEQLAGSKDNHRKIEADKKIKKVSIKEEKREQERIVLENLRKEEEHTEKEFNKSFQYLKDSKSSFIEKTYFPAIEFIKSVVRGFNNSFIFLGSQGLGKSTITLQTLLKENAKFVYFQGFLTPLQLYKTLYEYREGYILVFDDVSGLISNNYSLSLILSALWSATDKRKVSWNSTTGKLDIPTETIFGSRIIFITNKLPNSEYAELVMSRCLNYEISLNYRQILIMMSEIAKMPHDKFSKEQRLEIVDFIKENTDETTKNFDLRIQKKAENLYLYNKEKWKELALILLNKKDSKLALVKKLLLSATYVKEAVEEYSKMTGDTARNFYYLKNKLTEKLK